MNKEKLNKNHIIAYISYDLKVIRHDNEDYILNVIGFDDEYLILSKVKTPNDEITKIKSRWCDINDNKLILKPLSYLEDQLRTEKFSILNMQSLTHDDLAKLCEIAEKLVVEPSHISLAAYMWLIKNHYDVFELIEKGFAIDINKKATDESV